MLRHREKSRKTEETNRIGELSETVAALLDHQRELSGRLAQMTDQQARSSAELDRAVNERLDGMTKRLGDGLQSQTEKNHESLSKLQERLAVIDRAQRNLTRLSTQMVGLQDILSNKQARGAGEIQLNGLLITTLPPSAIVPGTFPVASGRLFVELAQPAGNHRHRRNFRWKVI